MREPRYENPIYAEALLEQRRLKSLMVPKPLPEDLRFVAGADVSCGRFGSTLWGAIVVCDLKEKLRPAASSVARMEVSFPYLPGLLAFREIPVLKKAWEGLKLKPDVILCDAHGIAHPRGFGEAAHLGVVLGVSSVGCAKSLLCGSFEMPSMERGSWSNLVFEGRLVGAALRTRSRVAPVFVSAGHFSDLPSAIALVMACSPRLRIPEPIRQAHALCNAARRGEAREG
ncbi:MAG: endonuclease V [Acidobacteria bacterium]|nr:endonuclease V [Acidobacteriota bacterium]